MVNHKAGKRIKLTLLAAFAVLGVLYAITVSPAARALDRTSEEPVTEMTADMPDLSALIDPNGQTTDYSRFQHGNAYHSRLPCLLCHTRNDNSARMSFPGRNGHLPCAGCHSLQFQDNTSPICTICHTATGMKRFPGLKSFGARFNHGRHQRVNCAVCHKQTGGRGAALTIPSGGNAHTTCFSCHSASQPSTMSSCNVCHQPGRLVRTSQSARSFNVGFTHSRHMRGTRFSCNSCHTIQAGAARGRQVTAPAASMHFARAGSLSCGGCHNGQKAFGPDEPANCKRCHTGRTFKF
jgi:c(7)-type cytochrome triheme protein